MSYEDEVWKRAAQKAADEWDDWKLIAQEWARYAVMNEGSYGSYRISLALFLTAVSGNSVAADIDTLRDMFIEEKSELFYGDAEAELREEAQEAADSQREDEWAARMAELREVNLRG